MSTDSIKKHLGEKWLSNLITISKSSEWVNKEELKTTDSAKIGYSVLEKIDEVIARFEKIEGFSSWVQEVRNSSYKNLQHLLFELISLENLLVKSSSFELKPVLSNGKNPEALVKKGESSFYVENLF